MRQYFPKSFNLHFGDSIKVKVDFSNYETKTDIKNISHTDTSRFALKADLTNIKTEVNKIDIDKLVTVPTDLSKLGNVDVIKKTGYDKLVAKVNSIDTSDFVLKTKYQTDKTEIENKIPDTSDLVEKTDYSTKVTEIENKIPDIRNLPTKAVFTTVENKIPNVSNLVKKQTITQKLQRLKRNLLTIIMTNILQLQSLIL